MTEQKKASPQWRGIRQEPEYELKDGLYVIKEWKGVLSVADQKENKVEVVNPSVSPVLNQYVVIALTILVSIAAVLMSIPSMPPVVHTIAAVVVAIASALGIASPGLTKKAATSSQDSLK